MKFYAIIALFVVVVGVAIAAAAWCRRKLGSMVALVLGVLLTIVAVWLYFLGKSDSVADTFAETVADALPPIVIVSAVIGWWIGYAMTGLLASWWGERRGRANL